jgi:hypothetical protein
MGLRKRNLCTHCNCSMIWYIYNKIKDKYVQKCLTETSPKYKTTHSIRYGSMFEDCEAYLTLVTFAMYLWTAGTRQKLTCQLTRLSKPIIIMVYSFLRVKCRQYFKNNLIKLGGNSGACQVDDSMFTHKPKHHQVQQWKQRDGYVCCIFKKC